MNTKKNINKILKNITNIEFIHTDRAKRNYKFYISYRDENNKRLVLEDDDFYPYFYLPEDVDITNIQMHVRKVESNYNSLFNEKVKKITLNKLSKDEFMNVISKFDKTYEDDVMFLHRYIIDNNVSYTKNQRILYFDIENNFSLDVVNADKEIISISCYDNFADKYYMFAYHPKLPLTITKEKDYSVYKFGSEREMLIKFCDFLKVFKFDIITGWNVERFDLPYLMNRMRKLNLSQNNLSMFNKAFCIVDEKNDTRYVKIYGISIIDLLPFYKKITGDNKPNNYRLGTVAKHLLGKEYDKLKIDLIDSWHNNIDLLLEYNKKDAELCVGIDRKARLIEQLLYLQEMVPIPLQETTQESRIIDQHVLHKYHNVFVFNSKRKNEKIPFQGPKIISPTVGIHKKVVMFDFKSMYPSIYITFNISPETVAENGDVTINGLQFTQQQKGILPEILEEWLVYRYKLKKEMKSAKDDLEKSILDNRQGAVKMLLNSVYGAMGYKNFRLYNIDIPSTITAIARDLLTFTENYFIQLGHPVIYGHTDSVAVKLPIEYNTEDIDAFIKLHEKNINTLITTEFIPQYGRTKKCIIEIEGDRDKIFDYMLLDEGEARYVAYKEKEDKLVIKGFEFKKRDTPIFFRNVTYSLIKMLIKETPWHIIKEYINSKFKEMQNKKIYDIGADKPINNFLETYKTNIQHIRAAKFSNKYLGTNFTRNHGGRLIFIKSARYNNETDCVLLEEDTTLLPEITIDYDRVFEFHVLNRLLLLKNIQALKINILVQQLKQRHTKSLMAYLEA